MIDLRTITVSFEFSLESDADYISKQLSSILLFFKQSSDDGLSLRTRRIVLLFKDQITRYNLQRLVDKLRLISNIASENNVRWFSLPLTYDNFEKIEFCPDICARLLTSFSNLFLHLIVEDLDKVSLASYYYAQSIHRVSTLSSSGITNFRLGISNGKTNNTPFFPFAYFNSSNLLSVGVETLLPLIDFFSSNHIHSIRELETNRLLVTSYIANQLTVINTKLTKLLTSYEFEYTGMDISLAPIPRTGSSIGSLFNHFNINRVGEPLSLTLTSSLTQILKDSLVMADVPSSGFNGVMFSPLEDDVISSQSIRLPFSIYEYLLLATVCGCGLDMIPLSGDILCETLASFIKDTIILSNRLNKPLGIRLLPVPGKKSAHLTSFNHDFLSDMRIFEYHEVSSLKNIIH